MKTPVIVLAALLSAVAARGFAAQPAAPAADHFDVLEYRVLGNTVLPAIEIERTLYPLLGTGKELADVEQARSTLENVYRAAGYGTVFVDIPEQDTADGIIRLKVTEGRLERTTVGGAHYFSGRDIKAALPEATAGEVPHLPTLQDELAALNAQTTDRVVTPALKPGQSPGTMALALNVQDTLPLHGRFEVNDQYSLNTSKLRAIAALSYDNLFARLDSLSVQFQTAPEEISESKVWALSYTTRLPDPRARLSAFYIKSDSRVANVGEAGAPLQVLGRGDIYGLRYIRTLLSQAESTHLLVAGAEYKDFLEVIPDFIAPGEELDEDDPAKDGSDSRSPISYLNLSLGHMSSWRQPLTQWSLSSTFNFGVRGAINTTTEFRRKRFEGKPNYFFLREDASMVRALPLGMSLRLRASGQYTRDSIISNEQYAIAGADGVRGYFEAEVLSDVAVKTSLELASPSWQAGPANAQAFAFYDLAHTRRVNPLRDDQTLEPLEPPHVRLSSVGAGMSFGITRYFSADLTWALALDDSPADGGTRARDSRLQFGVRSTW
jgi:hemolysin activation/secretion protein